MTDSWKRSTSGGHWCYSDMGIPTFWETHSQKPSDMGILCNPNPVSLGLGNGDAHITVTVAFAKEKYNGFSQIIFERFRSILTVS